MISSKKDKRKEKLITVEGESDSKAQEIIVHRGAIPKKRAITAWSWHEEFTAEWSETLITRKKKKHR